MSRHPGSWWLRTKDASSSQYSRIDEVPRQDYPINTSKVEVQSFLREISATKGLVCLVWQRSFIVLPTLVFTLTWGGGNEGAAEFCIGAPDSTRPLSQLFSLKYIVVNVCTEKTNLVQITSPYLFTRLHFWIVFGVILMMQNTQYSKTDFLQLVWVHCKHVQLMGLLIYFRLTLRW